MRSNNAQGIESVKILSAELIIIQRSSSDVCSGLIKEQSSYGCRLLIVTRRAKPRQDTLKAPPSSRLLEAV